MTQERANDEDRLRLQFNRVFASVYERIGFVRLNEVVEQLGVREVRLWDLLVPLRSNLSVSMTVCDGHIDSGEIYRVGAATDIVTAYKSGVIQTRLESTLNPDFFSLLFDSLLEISAGRVGAGLKAHSRPLIASTLWADGRKSDVADLEVISACSLFQHVVVLGPPGSGKTTIAKALATAHLRPFLDPQPLEGPSRLGLWEDSGAVPLFVELKAFVGSKYFPDLGDRPTAADFQKYVQEVVFQGNSDVMMKVVDYLQRSQGLIILDGLDEVPVPLSVERALEKRHEQLVNLVRSLVVNFPRAKVIVTSRPAGYSGWTLPGFEVIHVRPLSTDEATQLARSYYLAAGETSESADALSRRLVREMATVPRTVTEFPLFVCLLAALLRERGGAFPSQRAALLEASLDLLLGTWTQQRLTGKTVQEVLHCSPSDLVARLSAVALRAFTESEGSESIESSDIPLGTLLEELVELGRHVNPNEVLDFIANQAGIVTSPAPRRVRFVHRLFQEYLVALAISRNPNPAVEMNDKVINNPILWREVALLFADILSNSHRSGDLALLVERLVARAHESGKEGAVLALGAEIAVEEKLGAAVGGVSTGVRSTVGQFVEALKGGGLTGVQRRIIGLAISDLGDPRVGVGVSSAGTPEIYWEHIGSGILSMGSGPQELNIIRQLSPGRAWNLQRESIQHPVEVLAFRASRYLVTVTQFRAFVEAEDGYWADGWWTQAGLRLRDRAGPPVSLTSIPGSLPQTGVTWYEATAFCAWLSARLGTRARLPTEPEWEYLAKGETTFVFPWGDDPDVDAANTLDTGLGTVAPIGCFRYRHASHAGMEVHDLIGNVWQWCSTLMELQSGRVFPYPYDPSDGREDLTVGDEGFRCTRGGYFDVDWNMARSAYRGRDLPAIRVDRQGFRVVADIEES